MSARVEGTFALDGLVEGGLGGAGEELRGRLLAWADTARAAGLNVSLDVSGDAFSLLGESRPVRASDLGDAPAQRVAALLFDLLKILPVAQRRNVFSTLRSTEYRPGEEVQTIYAVAPDGSVQTHQRTVSARTEAPPAPLTMKQKVRMGLTGLAVALGVFGLSALFVDYGQLFRRVRDTVVPLNVEKVQVDTGSFARYLTVEKKALAAESSGGRVLVLTLQRTKDFPLKDADLAAASGDGKLDLPGRLTLEALARGYVRYECFDADGTILNYGELRLAGLRDKETVEVPVPLAPDHRLARIRLGF